MIQLDGSSLTIEQLVAIADRDEPVTLSDAARARVRAARAVVERAATSRRTGSTPASVRSPT
jgi:histidine ammonia-lyase